MALVLHAAVLAWWLAADESEGAHAAGLDGMQVSVGLAGSFSEPSQASKAAQVIPNETVETDPVAQSGAEAEPEKKQEQQQEPRAVAESVPEPAVEAEPQQEPLPEAAPVHEMQSSDAVALQKPAPSIARPVVRAPARPAPKRQPEHKPKPVMESPRRADEAPERPVGQQAKPDKAPTKTTVDTNNKNAKRASVKATGTGQRVETGGNPAARQSYLAEVLARIARHKRYPREARHDGVTGVVTVTFTITANGTVLTQQVSGSSGDHRLDRAALDMLLRASPLPPIPRDMGVASLELTLPVEFSLNQKRKLF